MTVNESVRSGEISSEARIARDDVVDSSQSRGFGREGDVPPRMHHKRSQREDAFLPTSRPSRVVIDRIQPEVDGGRFPAKRFLDEHVEIEAVLLVDGHDGLKGRLLYRHEEDPEFSSTPMKSLENDRWRGRFQPSRLGRYLVTVEAAIDRFETWRSDLKKKMSAGQNVSTDIASGVLLLDSWRTEVDASARARIEDKIRQWKEILTEISNSPRGSHGEPRHLAHQHLARMNESLDDPGLAVISESIYDKASLVRYSKEVPIQIEPRLARFSAWYEFFPRSAARVPGRHGTFRDVESRLEYVRDLGFDIVYFPPIHPIGQSFRKGKNNALEAADGDVGSPWAIGRSEGGHRAIHPELGTHEDFDRLVTKARELGLEVALDIALQCSPDHPYVKDHPEWFRKRPDGTIQYAENPPKKYQDIYPFDFESKEWRALWTELKNVVQFWVDKGVRVFRVDNPHTKPFHFWEWLIREIKSKSPEVIFLSEAFTRPHVMAYLAKAGFSQSYTYFTWRNTKHELTQYLNELTQTDLVETFGANFWPNTPDILPQSLQSGRRSVFMQRLILAATLSSNYGIYGPVYELMEHKPRDEGSEEYLDSEKYQIRTWDWNQAGSLAPLIQRVNQIRRSQQALQSNVTLRFHPVSNDALIAYSKATPDGERVLVIVNLDSEHVHSGFVELPLLEWSMDPSETFQVHDLLTDARYYWSGWRNYVELNPHSVPAHIFAIRRRVRTASDFEYYE